MSYEARAPIVPAAPITPRPDQIAAQDAVLAALAAGMRRPLVEAPCGWGKSVPLGTVALDLAQHGRRVLLLAHRRELLEQNTGAIRRLDPAADIGICSASLKADRLDAAITIGSTPTVFRPLPPLGHIHFVFLGEAPLLGPGSPSILAKILEALGQ